MITLEKNVKGSYDAYCMVKSVAEKVNSKGAPYLDFVLCDNTGEVNAKLWDYKPTEHGTYSAGDIIKIRAGLNQFNGQDQLRIDLVRHVTGNDEFDYSAIVPSADYDSRKMLGEIYSILSLVKDSDIRNITEAILKENEEKVLVWPAAFKLHHAMRGGLLYHTLSILRLAEAVTKIYPSVDYDMLVCGAILHDISKIDEFDVNPLGIVKQYSVKGELLGHLVMGAMRVEEKAKQLGIVSEKVTYLEHMMVSHHGQPDYGSPIRPMTLEAIVLSMLDTLDATVFEVEAAVKAVSPGAFTERQWALDNRKLFNTGIGDVSTHAELF